MIYKKIVTLSIVTSSALLMSGCMEFKMPNIPDMDSINIFSSNEVSIHSVKPAKVPLRSKDKTITVSKFQNDTTQLSNKIISVLNGTTVKGNKYFTVINQFETDKKLKNLGFVDTGLIRKEESLKIKKATGSESLILGNLSEMKVSYRFFEENRQRCNKDNKDCYHREVKCKTTNFDLTAFLRVIDLKTSEILFSESINKMKSYRFCEDDQFKIPSNETIKQMLSIEIAHEFVDNLTPVPYSFKVKILTDDEFYKFSEDNKNKMKTILANIKRGRYVKSADLLVDLILDTNNESYIPIYNLGIMKEAMGELIEAERLFYRAEKLCPKPIDEVLDAIVRVKKLQKERNILHEDIEINQIKRTKEELAKLKKQAEEMKLFKIEQDRLAKIKLEMETKRLLKQEQDRLKEERRLEEIANLEAEKQLREKIRKEAELIEKIKHDKEVKRLELLRKEAADLEAERILSEEKKRKILANKNEANRLEKQIKETKDKLKKEELIRKQESIKRSEENKRLELLRKESADLEAERKLSDLKNTENTNLKISEDKEKLEAQKIEAQKIEAQKIEAQKIEKEKLDMIKDNENVSNVDNTDNGLFEETNVEELTDEEKEAEAEMERLKKEIEALDLSLEDE